MKYLLYLCVILLSLPAMAQDEQHDEHGIDKYQYIFVTDTITPTFYEKEESFYYDAVYLRKVDDKHYPAYITMFGQEGEMTEVKQYRYTNFIAVNDIRKMEGKQVLIRYVLKNNERVVKKINLL